MKNLILNKILFSLCLLIFSNHLFSQSYQFKGKINNYKSIHNCFVLDSSQTKITVNDSGDFSFEGLKSEYFIIISENGFAMDTFKLFSNKLNVLNIKESYQLSGVKIKTDGSLGHFIGKGIEKTEIITHEELKKAACCDLAGCFETQGTVQPMTTNVLTNSKELRILGLSGVYNQLLIDGFPMFYGLAFTYGISTVPGTLVENIFVSKGSNSVLQGYDNMVGQINVITQLPNKKNKLLVNLYMNSFLEKQGNVNFQFKTKKLNHLSSVHFVMPANRWDRDKDKFMDLPLMTRALVFHKVKFREDFNKGYSFSAAFKVFNEERVGGQTNFDKKNVGNDSIYGQQVKYHQFDIYTKQQFRISESKAIQLFSSYQFHDQNSWFGTLNYKAFQNFHNHILQFENEWREKHNLKIGFNHRQLIINENIKFNDSLKFRFFDGEYLKNEKVSSLFAENVFKWRGDLIQMIAGFRADYLHHEKFFLSPRIMLKYEWGEDNILRASFGKSWRTANLFSENIGILSSSRDVIFAERILPEQSINFGINWFKKLKFRKFAGFLTMDLYQNRFQRQFFPNYDKYVTKILIENFNGKSIANAFQTDLNLKWNKILEFKLAYNFLDVFREINKTKENLPFVSKHRFLVNFAYLPKNKKWRYDVYAHWFGKQRLPHTHDYPLEYQQPNFSKSYFTFNTQITKMWKKLEVYGGVENLFDYRQLRPILSWQNPFSPYFDTSFNWGPTRGREIYIGLRFKPF